MDNDTIYVDGTDHILGRLSSWIAKKVLLGQKVVVVNAQNILVSGKKRSLIEAYLVKRRRATHTNPTRGPMFPRFPDRILRRTIRGMLPWKTTSGRLAYRRVSAFLEVPEKFADIEFTTIDVAKKRLSQNYITVGELSENLGWRYNIESEA